MFERGFLTVGRLRGVPIRLHWSTALGAFFFGGLRFVPAFWLAFVVLVLVHEFGHALFAQRLGHRALAVDVTGFGGLCHWDARRASALDHYVVAWGGVVAQLLLLLLTATYSAIAGPPTSVIEAQIVSAFIGTNLWLIGLNLIPVAPLDGARAWKLFGELRRRRITPWSLVQRWAHRRRFYRSAGAKPPPQARQNGTPEGQQSASTGGSQAELARLFESVAEEARRARETSRK